jgi:hypothetical protein
MSQCHSPRITILRARDVLETGHLIPNQLQMLECRSVSEGKALGKIVRANARTLETLRLGKEKELVEQYQRPRIEITQPLDIFTTMKLQNLLRLREIALYGLDVSSLIPQSIPEAMFFCQLECMLLESCSGSEALLETLAGTFHFAKTSETVTRTTPKLKKFLFRHEALTTPLKDALIHFLTSFSGLTTLFLLFENATHLERPSALIAEHGRTLETLVLESRIQPREHLGLDTSQPFGGGGYSQELWEAYVPTLWNWAWAFHGTMRWFESERRNSQVYQTYARCIYGTSRRAKF